MPKIFSSRSRNVADTSVLKHAGTQVFQSKGDYFKGNVLGYSSNAVTPHSERYGVAPYLTKSSEVQQSLMDMDVKLQSKGMYTSGVTPHFFKQVKDAENYVADMNMQPATMLNSDFPYTKSFVGKDIQYDVDFFIRQANNFDVIYKKSWNLLEKMKFKLDQEPDGRYATIGIEDSVNGTVYVLQWEDEELYQASKKVLSNENELKTLLKRMPEPTLLFQVRHPQLQELVQFRIDMENLIFKLASKSKGPLPTALGITGTIK